MIRIRMLDWMCMASALLATGAVQPAFGQTYPTQNMTLQVAFSRRRHCRCGGAPGGAKAQRGAGAYGRRGKSRRGGRQSRRESRERCGARRADEVIE
jgi:hypothetical protein